MVFCAADSSHPSYGQSEITFPHQVELKCNLDEVKANLRGLKNKPGSTRPADITSLIRKRGGYQNVVQMTYALTQKVRDPPCLVFCVYKYSENDPLCLQAKPTMQKFFLVVNLVQKQSIDELIERLKRGKIISRERVVQESKSPFISH